MKKAWLIAAIALFSTVSFALPTQEAHFSWEKCPIFNVIFGFAGCVLIIVLSKALGKFLQRKEDYYD